MLRIKVTTNTILPTALENVDETVEIPEYRLTLETSTVDNADFAEDENVDTMSFDLPDKIMVFKKMEYIVRFSGGNTSN